ncbi:MAG: topoisomerase DNA-binding C4 zinc finger domain-containing protein, partial [Nanoarchaeota archaeon]
GFLIIKESKQGKKFIACTNWPKCKKTFSIPEFKRLLKRKCPKCGARIFSLKNKKKYCAICKEFIE